MMKSIISILCTVIIAALVSYFIVTHSGSAQKIETDQKAFERVMTSNVLRCAYIVIPPTFNKDTKTGGYSGIGYDIVEAMAKSLNLKVEWIEEVNFGNLAEGLKTQRYDAVCFPLYLGNVSMAKVIDYTTPVFYTGTGVVVRSDDHRFDNNLSAINASDVTIATIDGEASQFIRRDNYPQTKDYSMPQNTELAQVIEAVVTHKADVAFFNQSNFSIYFSANGKIAPVRDLAVGHPLRIHAHSFVVNKGETKLVSTLDTALREMEYAGQITSILKKYETTQGAILRIADPYAPLPME